MSFGAIEKSRRKGRPVNLFHVKYGDGANSYYAYTDAEQRIVVNGVEYTPLAIDRGKITASGTLDKAALEVRMSLNVPLAELFRVYPPSSVVNMTIYQGHLSDGSNPQFLVAWTGRVISAKRTDNELILTGEPINTTMKRVGLRRNYQYSCMHVLYGNHCKASKSAATKTVLVNAYTSTTITLPSVWESDTRAKKYIGGMVEWVNAMGDIETRTILRVLGNNVLVLAGFIRDMAVGKEVKVILGCNHGWYMNNGAIDEKTDCVFLHNNAPNFGGCPFIPTKNPVGQLNQYY